MALPFGMRLRAAAMAMFGDVQKTSAGDGWLIRAIGGGKTKAGVPVSAWTAMNLPVVWACVTLISDAHVQLPVDVVRHTESGREPLPGHPVAQLLNGQANDDMTAAMVLGGMEVHDLLWGNGYAEIEFNGRGEPVGLWPLLPYCTHPDVAFPSNRRQLRYRTTIDGRQFALPPERVLHFMDYSYDGICGISPVSAARQAIGMGLAMEEFGAKFFANDSKSGGFLMHPGKLGAKGEQNILASFTGDESGKGGQGGLEHAHRIKVLEEGMKFISTTIPPEDSQFLGSREFQVAEIARIYRVPLPLLQAHEKTTSWGSGIEQLLIGFVVWTIAPRLKRREQELGRKLLTADERRAGLFIKFNLNALMRGDMAARAAYYKAGITDGWMVRNEAREKEDMNPLPGLDKPLVQSTMQAADAAATPSQEATND